MHCQACQVHLPHFGGAIGEDEHARQTWGRPHRQRNGSILCLDCFWSGGVVVPTPQEQPSPTVDESDEQPALHIVSPEVWSCWYEQCHPYIPPGFHGSGSNSGRFRHEKRGTRIEREEWTP